METEVVTEGDKDDAAKPRVDIQETLDSIGCDSEYWAKRLKELSDAMETKAQIPKGGLEFVYSKKMKALDIRVKVQDMAHKLRGDYPSEKVEHTLTLEDKLRTIHEKRENDPD